MTMKLVHDFEVLLSVHFLIRNTPLVTPTKFTTVIPRLTSDPANEFFG